MRKISSGKILTKEELQAIGTEKATEECVDVSKLLDDLIFYKNIVLRIGKLNHQWDFDEECSKKDYPTEIYDLEDKCKEIYLKHVQLNGLLICEYCGCNYRPETSISKELCSTCLSKAEMEYFGWDDETDVLSVGGISIEELYGGDDE